MKALSTLLICLFVMTAFSAFVPVPDFDLGHIEGPWNIQSAYDTYGNNWTLTYCFTFTFNIINTSAVNLTSSFYNGFTDERRVDSVMLYPDPENAAIMYQDVDHEQPPLLVLNESSFPFWQGNKEPLLIIAFNYSNATKDRLIIFGLSKAEDSEYDIRPYLEINHFPVSNTQNFWFINTACDSYFSWTPLNAYNATNLLKDWNLIAVYDPTGAGIVPWYTGDAIFDWTQAYCAKISFKPGRAYDDLMTLSLKSLYEGTFERTWQILPNPENNAILMGFNMDANTLLYISYADMLGNIVLTTGATTSFFLSTKVKTFTAADRLIFNAVLSRAGFAYDTTYIYPIDDTVC